jgi:AmmeMemoRadiSam system protein B/AmmeMemoRadiSam system protein A
MTWLRSLAVIGTLAAATAATAAVREPNVAGKFYPDDPAQLRAAVVAFLAEAVPQDAQRAIGLLAPHAGYAYSGQFAADAWRQATGRSYDVVVILGTHHTSGAFAGAAIDDVTGLRTPLGVAAVDQQLARALLANGKLFTKRPEAFDGEHSVEVQVPFAQVVLPGVKILPVVVGTDDPALCGQLGKALAVALGGRRALLVASSDLSHYPAHDAAARLDARTLTAAATLDPAEVGAAIARSEREGAPGEQTCACGAGALMTMLAAAKALGAPRAVALSIGDSGETALGEPDRVVGYGALAVTDGPAGSQLEGLGRPPVGRAGDPLDDVDRHRLLTIARDTLARYFATGTTPLVRGVSPRLLAQQGAFVTLKDRAGRLRGCIGHLAQDRPIGQLVGAMAMQAALNDRRFPPVTGDELASLSIEISVLTPPAKVRGAADVVVGRDGVVLRQGGRSAVFLPQVATEQGWDRDTLLAQLSEKAGLPADAWRRPDAELLTFQAQVFAE